MQSKKLVRLGAQIFFGIALIATFITGLLIKFSTFSSIRFVTFDVQSSELAGAVPDVNPNTEISTVRIWDFDQLSISRWLEAASLGIDYSPAIVALFLLGLILWKIQSEIHLGQAISVSIVIFGLWMIISSVLGEGLRVLSLNAFISENSLSTDPKINSVWIQEPQMFFTQQIILMSSIGLVLIAVAVLVKRGFKAELELESVI
jgi:hypothetical protein